LLIEAVFDHALVYGKHAAVARLNEPTKGWVHSPLLPTAIQIFRRLGSRQMSLSRQLRGKLVSPVYYATSIEKGNNAIVIVPNKGTGPKRT
jgi:hypothetical protein